MITDAATGSGNESEPITVCCLKWGTLYGPEYVNVLFNMVSRHLTKPFRFVCFTEDASDLHADILIAPLPEFEEPPWEYARYCSAWRKLALFSPSLSILTGRVLFLDLDVVITDNIDCLFEFPLELEQVGMIENWYQPDQRVGQASVMVFNAGGPVACLNYYLAHTQATLECYRTEQAFIAGYLDQFTEAGVAFFPKSWCRSYKMHAMPQGVRKWLVSKNHLPEAVKILVFHGRPNPPDAIKGHWGKRFPWYKRWYKRIHPSPWLQDYWR